MSQVGQTSQEFLIFLILIDAMHETGIYLDIIEAEIGEFLKFGEVVAKVVHADAAAKFLEGMTKVMESLKFAESAVLRHFKPKPVT